MRLLLIPASCLNYLSDNWQVEGVISHLSSLTPTTIPNGGYGGYGWAMKVVASDSRDVKIALYKNGVKISDQALKSGEECFLVPDGGSEEDYLVEIKR